MPSAALKSVAADHLPRVVVDVPPMGRALLACLPDFTAAALPERWPVSPLTEYGVKPYYWLPTLGELSFVRNTPAEVQTAELGWRLANPEIMQAGGADPNGRLQRFNTVTETRGEPLEWEYEFTLNEPRAVDAGRFDAATDR